jgi:hypothetical protein
MGMFDNIRYNGNAYQTKDTPTQMLDNYKIEDGYLWVEEYDAEWMDDPDGFLGGYLKHSNERWVRCDDFDGKIIFYRMLDKDKWEEYAALFMDGKMVKIVDRTEDE